ncbi:hypothetical protein CHS0354_017352 [Potamilus streckersoni]|uniref:Protein kinase domain-containing protein n=1 Tax=Potamilus streckersoni TaxID=2493646 RepID=A0AAE0T526_9BIVA|nr:hypothetical protein CHS0354_017352 [Potamilus streckersoni]
MTNLEVGTDFTFLHEPHGQNASKSEKAYSDDEFWPKCPADQDVQGMAQLKGSLVCEDPVGPVELAKAFLNIDLRHCVSQLSELGINIISQDLPLNTWATDPLEHPVPEKVCYTTKNGGEEFIHQLKQPQTPCTQGSIWEKGLAVHDGQYTEGVHFQPLDKNRFSGSFGTGFRCVDCQTGKHFFKKQTSLDKFHKSEVLIPIHLDHENVTKLYGVIQRDDKVEIIMEDAGISLAYFVMLNPRLEERLVLNLMKQGLAGIKKLHEIDVIHHDIKPDNLCVFSNTDRSFTLKITDFGSARYMNQPVNSMTWTPAYLAPEACRRVLQQIEHFRNIFGNSTAGNRYEQITGKVDVFALGLSVLFMIQKRHVLLYKMTEGQISYNNLPAKDKRKLDFKLLHYLAVHTELAQYLIPKDCSLEMQHLLFGMLSGSPNKRFSAAQAYDFIDYMEVKQKECQQTQNGRLVTHPSENHQDACEMNAIYGGVKDLTKEKLRKKTLKNIKEREVLAGGTDVISLKETVKQNLITNPLQPPLPMHSRKMETNIETKNVAANLQPLERAVGAMNQRLDVLLNILHVQQSTKQREPSVLNGVYHNPGVQNSRPQTDMSNGGKAAKRKHKAELYHHSGKKMRQSVSGDSTTVVPALPASAIPYSGLFRSNILDETEPIVVNDTQPVHKNTTKSIGKDSTMHDQEGNMPDFSKLF